MLSQRKLVTAIIAWIFFSVSVHDVYAMQSDDLRALADHYMEAILTIKQPYAYSVDLPLDSHDRFLDNAPETLVEFQRIEDATANSLHKINPSELADETQRIFYSKFKEYIEANKGLRICHDELWQFDPMFFGTHLLLNQLVDVQPVTTQKDKEQALQRWEFIETYYQQEVINLKKGLKRGYTAPKRVVNRVIEQINRIVEVDIDSHPYLKLAVRSGDEAFQREFTLIVKKHVIPALQTYGDYLQHDYLVKTRSELGLHANTDGRQCYMAKYRYYTSLQRTPEEIHQLGLKTVNRQEQEAVAIAKKLYGVDTFEAALTKANEDSSEQFADAETLHAFYEEVVRRAMQVMPQVFDRIPATSLVVEPVPAHLQGTGVSATYQSGNAGSPGKFIYDPANYAKQKRGRAEILALHEGLPGHHMQVALAQDQTPFHPLERLFTTNAYREGWARYAESLSEELGLYHSNSALIYRRAWPGRGMVADTALHVLGWSNEKITAFIAKSGKKDSAEMLLDRMGALPAQLTAYDSGALEIFRLRKIAEEKLGKCFDLKAFHSVLLKNGNVPFTVLIDQIETWVSENEGK